MLINIINQMSNKLKVLVVGANGMVGTIEVLPNNSNVEEANSGRKAIKKIDIFVFGWINFAGVLSKDSLGSIRRLIASCLEDPDTKKTIRWEALKTLGVNEILLIPLPSVKIKNSSTLLFFL